MHLWVAFCAITTEISWRQKRGVEAAWSLDENFFLNMEDTD